MYISSKFYESRGHDKINKTEETNLWNMKIRWDNKTFNHNRLPPYCQHSLTAKCLKPSTLCRLQLLTKSQHVKMCINEYDFNCIPRNNLTKRQKNLCNEQLAINRDIVCCTLAAVLSSCPKPVKCLEGIGVCGIYGMLWEKYFGEDVDVTINGPYEEDFNLIRENVTSNEIKGKVLNEDPCVILRKNTYDFIFLNCRTNTSQYLDSIFSTIKESAILVITTSEDPSLYWQAPEVALRNYGGVIAKTSYHRELAVRLVIAEMARACARYNKGLKILCSIAYKSQQSFTIIAKVIKGIPKANECTQYIQKLAHCNICEERKFITDFYFLDKVDDYLSCDCSKQNEGKVVIGLGPLWAGEIFDVDFVQSMIQHLKGFPWQNRVYSLLDLILEEARCSGRNESEESEAKKPKLNDSVVSKSGKNPPCFYLNTHRFGQKDMKLKKVSKIVSLLRNYGYRASRTHFHPEAVRTNAPLSEYVKILQTSRGGQNWT